MSISAIQGTAATQTTPLTPPKPAKPGANGTTDATQGAAGGGAQSSQAAAATSASTVVSEVTQTNADGSTTLVTTYGNGTTSTATQSGPSNGKGAVPTLLDPSNVGQNSTLLAAQQNTANQSQNASRFGGPHAGLFGNQKTPTNG